MKYDIEMLISFVEKNGKMPKNGIKNEKELLSYFYRNKTECLKNSVIKETYEGSKIKKTKKNIKTLLDFIKKNDRMPRGGVENERSLYQWFSNNKEKCLNVSFVKKAYDKSIIKKGKYSVNVLKFFIEKNNRMPKNDIRNEKGLLSYFYRNKTECLKNLVIKKTYEESKIKKTKNNIEMLISFIDKNKRMPRGSIKNEKGLYSFFLQNKEDCLNVSIVREAYKKSKIKDFKYSNELLVDFIKENGRMPKYSGCRNEKGLYRWFRKNKEACLNNKKISKVFTMEKEKTKVVRLKSLVDFIKENDRLPNIKIKTENSLYQWFYANREYSLQNNLVKEKYALSRKKTSSIEELTAFVIKNDRLPKNKTKEEILLRQWFNGNKMKCFKIPVISEAYLKERSR